MYVCIVGHIAHNSEVWASADGQPIKIRGSLLSLLPPIPLSTQVGNPSLRFPMEFLLATGDFPFVSLESEWKRECYSFMLFI